MDCTSFLSFPQSRFPSFWVCLATEKMRGPSFLQFVVNATGFPLEDYYDFIIVGGGTAGCPFAATLLQSYRVLVLERGGVPYGRPNLMTQEDFLSALMVTDTFDSPAQAFTSEDGIPNARGRVIGDGSVINARFYSRADEDFYRNSGFNWDCSCE